MAKAFKCDKCGKLFDKRVKIPEYAMTPAFRVTFRIDAVAIPDPQLEVAFCEDCTVLVLKNLAAIIEKRNKGHKSK